MITRSSLEAMLGEVQYRSGALHAERHDLQEQIQPEGAPVKFQVNLDVFPADDEVRVDVKVTSESEIADYSVLISGRWALTDHLDITAKGAETAVIDLAVNVCAPRLIAIAEMKLNDLARAIDAPRLTFEHRLDQQLNQAYTSTESRAKKADGQ